MGDTEMISYDSDQDILYKMPNGGFSARRPKHICNHQISLVNLRLILTVDVIQQYPKLSLLVYDCLQDYMHIFENEYIRFFTLWKDLIVDHPVSSASKRIKVNECGGKYRQDLLNIFGTDYERNLKEAALKRNRHVDGSSVSAVL